MKCPVVSFGVSMGLEFLWAACILTLLHCWRISMVYLALELVASWVEFGFSVGMEALDELLSINVSWNQEFSGVLKFWICASSLWPSVLFLKVASRPLHPYSTYDKTSR